MTGGALNFSAADLKASAAAYNPALHEAPLVIGHPAIDAPAYGWVQSLSFADGNLYANTQQEDVAFTELVKEGRFKKISASFYEPNSPSNPVQGVYYLRHVGFLGAQPPAVKGLKAVEFSAHEHGVISFSEDDDITNATLWRGLREYFISAFGLDVADKTIPNAAVTVLEASAQAESLADTDTSSFHETNPTGDAMSADDKARLAMLEQENKDLKAKALAFAQTQAQEKTAALHTAHLAFADSLIGGGTLLPAQKAVTVALLDTLANQPTVLNFSDGDSALPLLTGVKTLLSALPKQIEFSEVGAGSGDNYGSSSVQFAAPQGAVIDSDRLKLHGAALSYQAQHNCDYLTAAKAVGA